MFRSSSEASNYDKRQAQNNQILQRRVNLPLVAEAFIRYLRKALRILNLDIRQ
jgi:hypothetical protein